MYVYRVLSLWTSGDPTWYCIGIVMEYMMVEVYAPEDHIHSTNQHHQVC